MEQITGMQQERREGLPDGPFTVREVAVLIRASAASVYRMIRSGHLPAYYIGTGTQSEHARVTRETLEQFMRGDLTPRRTTPTLPVRDTGAGPFRGISAAEAIGDWR